MLCWTVVADSAPVPVTPDYGGPVARYADGNFDARFNRYIAVREGRVVLLFRVMGIYFESFLVFFEEYQVNRQLVLVLSMSNN